MSKRWKGAIAILVVLTVISSIAFFYLTLSVSSHDHWAQDAKFNSIEQQGNSSLVFHPPHAYGYPDKNVAYTDVAFALWINGTQMQPNNLHLKGFRGMGATDVNEFVQMSKGIGPEAAAVFNSIDCSYLLVFHEDYQNGHIDNNDLLTLECTHPLSSGTNVTLKMYVDIDGTWGIGLIQGTYIVP